VDENYSRLERIEALLTELRSEVGAITAVLPLLGREPDRRDAKAGRSGKVNSLEAAMDALESSLIRWLIGTMVPLAALSFAAAKWIG
jgi:hypothetical protein